MKHRSKDRTIDQNWNFIYFYVFLKNMKINNILFHLIDSKITKVLSLFYLKQDYKYSLSELTKMSKVPKTSVHRILKKLVELKLIKYEEFKSIKVYFLNKEKTVLDLGELFYPPKTYVEAINDYFSSVPNLSNVYQIGFKDRELQLIAVVLSTSKDFENRFLNNINNILKKYNKSSSVVFQTLEQFKQFNKMGLYKNIIEIFKLWYFLKYILKYRNVYK